MKMFSRFALAATLALASVGMAEAFPVAPHPDGAAASAPLTEKTAMVETQRVVRRGPFGGRRVVTTRRVVRPGGGVTVTKTVR